MNMITYNDTTFLWKRKLEQDKPLEKVMIQTKMKGKPKSHIIIRGDDKNDNL